MTHRRPLRALTALLATVACSFGALTLVPMANASPNQSFQLRGGVSDPIYSYANAIRETVYVPTGFDLDGDNVIDRVAADIVRPSEAAQQGKKVPVIMDASPYYDNLGRGNESEKKTYNGQQPVGFPLFYDNYFVPRGYAVVLVDLAGTTRSEGCSDIGGKSDVASAKKVIDWLNGNADGFTTKAGNAKASSSWSTGATGMIGKSYDGTIANGVAATGVPGLKTIVPIGAISSWYDYYRSDGVSFGFNPVGLANTVEKGGRPDCGAQKTKLTNGATGNGDYNAFWAERDYLPNASKVKASVFVVHGQGDLNVKTLHYGQWWDKLGAAGVTRKIWLTQAGHVDPFDFRRSVWVDTLHRWFDRWLLGVNNGIENEPRATIERAPDTWVNEPTWPLAGTEQVNLRIRKGQNAGLGQLGTTQATPGSTEKFTDTAGQGSANWAANPNTASNARTLFSTGPLAKDLRISGTGSVTVRVTPTTSTAHLSAVLVHYGPSTIRNYAGAGEGISTLGTESCWGEATPSDNGCYKNTATTTANVGLEVFSRGWADLANSESLTSQTPIVPGQARTMTFRLASTDHVIPAGHRLAVIIAGTDSGRIVAPANRPTVTIDLARSFVTLPIVGGAATVPPAARDALTPDLPGHLPQLDPAEQTNGDFVRR
nr:MULTISPECIES: Xaa-Pro dipeptidyl-peptidase [unclassified Crossiella]